MDILNILIELSQNPIVKILISAIGGGTLFMILDKLIVQVIRKANFGEEEILEAVQKIDDYIDRTQGKFPEAHKALEDRICHLLDKAKNIIRN